MQSNFLGNLSSSTIHVAEDQTNHSINNQRFVKINPGKNIKLEPSQCELYDDNILSCSNKKRNIKPKKQLVSHWKIVDGKLVCRWSISSINN